MKNKTALFSIIFIIVLFFLNDQLKSDMLLKYNKTTDSYDFSGKQNPASGYVSMVKIGEDKMRVDDGKNYTCIIRLDKNSMYLLTHQNKSYMELNMNAGSMKETIKKELKKQLGEDADIESSIFMNPQISVKVNDIGEKKKIKSWNCRKYVQTMKMNVMGNQETVSELWTTEDIKINYELYSKFAVAMLSTMGMNQNVSKDILDEFKKLRGITVMSATSSDIMGNKIKTTEELIEVKETKFNDLEFELPEDYKKTSGMFGSE
ncbi:DUF4412 domain-containing protein [Candidatus Dependentiae bacterium]|nr:DUF4412 domain-containing protein [Candidatus Dependentiae bacterium]